MRPAPVLQAPLRRRARPGGRGRRRGGGGRRHRPAAQLIETALRVAYSAISPIISSVSVA